MGIIRDDARRSHDTQQTAQAAQLERDIAEGIRAFLTTENIRSVVDSVVSACNSQREVSDEVRAVLVYPENTSPYVMASEACLKHLTQAIGRLDPDTTVVISMQQFDCEYTGAKVGILVKFDPPLT